jgi:hypothetical protein
MRLALALRLHGRFSLRACHPGSSHSCQNKLQQTSFFALDDQNEETRAIRMVVAADCPKKPPSRNHPTGRGRKSTSFNAARRAYLPPQVVNISPYLQDYTQHGANHRPQLEHKPQMVT